MFSGGLLHSVPLSDGGYSRTLELWQCKEGLGILGHGHFSPFRVFVVIHTVTEVLPIFYLFRFSLVSSSHSFCAKAYILYTSFHETVLLIKTFSAGLISG